MTPDFQQLKREGHKSLVFLQLHAVSQVSSLQNVERYIHALEARNAARELELKLDTQPTEEEK